MLGVPSLNYAQDGCQADGGGGFNFFLSTVMSSIMVNWVPVNFFPGSRGLSNLCVLSFSSL